MNRWRKSAALASMLMAIAPAYADLMTGYDLYQDCTSSLETDRSFCLGFIGGVFGGSLGASSSATYCPTTNIKFGQMEMVFLNWARAHPAKLGGDAAIMVEAAFVEAWPCPKGTSPPKVSRIPPYPAPDQLLPSR